MKLSARNVVPGKILAVLHGPVTTQVTLEVAPGVEIVSTITSHSARTLDLKEGGRAYAVIKASSVMIAVD